MVGFTQICEYLKRFRRDQSGAVAIAFVLALPLFIGAIAMAVEVGYWRQNNAQLQSAADMAAIAGARELVMTKQGSAVQLASIGEAYENGFDLANGTYQVFSPPQTGTHAGKNGVEIVLNLKQDRYFTSIFSNAAITHSVRAVALLVNGDPPCVLSLHPTASQSIKVSGSSQVNMESCAVHSNSTASDSLTMSGSGSLTTSCAYSSGGITNPEDITLTDCGAVGVNQPSMDDPYADVDVPDDVDTMPCTSPISTGSWSITVTPGLYSLDCNNKKDLTTKDIVLEDGGTFIFDGIDLEVTSSTGSLVGSGVTLIFMNGATFKNNNGGVIDISAKTTGEYAGILFYGDRDTSDPNQVVKINGNQNAKMEGVFYFPVQDVRFNGGATSTSDCTHIVASTVEFTGNAKLSNVGCEALGTKGIGGASGSVALVQ